MKNQNKKSKIYTITPRKAAVFFIDRHRYDLDSATFVCDFWNEMPVDSECCMKENLFVTNAGSWVLYGTGGSQTKYGRQLADGKFVAGTGIKILQRIEAYDYIEQMGKMDDVTFQAYFDDIVKEG